MDPIKSVDDFKNFMRGNNDLVCTNAVDADEIALYDEWMQEKLWDEIYQEGDDSNA